MEGKAQRQQQQHQQPLPQRGPDGRFLPQEERKSPYSPFLMHKCNSLLKQLMNHKYGYVFNQPVDPIALGIPDYFTVITSPMDLGTIKANLRNNHYSSPQEFAADVRLTFANALKFNPPGDVVHNMAQTLSRVFESKWKGIEKKMGQMNDRSEQGFEEDDRGNYNRARFSSLKIVGMPPMTLEKLQNIVGRFLEWTDDVPEQIVDFVKRHQTRPVDDDDDEMMLDLNSLKNDEMWELHGLVSTCMENCDSSTQPRPSSSGGAAPTGDHMDEKEIY